MCIVCEAQYNHLIIAALFLFMYVYSTAMHTRTTIDIRPRVPDLDVSHRIPRILPSLQLLRLVA
jgi:hypothetical protein